MKIHLIILLTLFTLVTKSQDLDNLDSYSVDKFYKKINLDYGTLDESGNSIDFVYVETTLQNGLYDIELTDASGDLYEVKGYNIYIKFNHYFGYAGYGTECYLDVAGYSSTVYKKE